MDLMPMRFKTYTWPYNPETYSVTYQRRMAAHKAPFGECCMQEMGKAYRVMRGEGTFAGADAYQEFTKLAEVFADEGPGLLTHPVWPAAGAYFVSLQLTEEPLPDYVRYAFEFWEDCGETGAMEVSGSTAASGTAAAAPSTAYSYYTVKRGDTLWGIAAQYGVTLASLIAVNPQIKNPNLIYAGNQVRIP